MRHLLSDVSGFERLVRSKPDLLLATDFDGTLCPIAPAPAAVSVPRRTLELLQGLADSKHTVVAVITGRALSDIMERLPLGAVYAGNHGLEITGGGLQFRHPHADAARELLSEVCSGLELSVASWDGAWVENKGLTATVHYRHVEESEQNTVMFAIRSYMQRFDRVLGVRSGRKSIEIYPRVGWGKGEAVQYIRNELRLADALCLCMGDDETDESMFAAFPDDLCVRVSVEGPSKASYSLEDSSEVLTVLEHLCEWRNVDTACSMTFQEH